MKKLTAMLFAFLVLAGAAFAQNYNNGNGTILSEETRGEFEIVHRKHEQTVTMSENADILEPERILWDDFTLWENFSYRWAPKNVLEEECGVSPLIDDCSGKVIHIMEILKISRAGKNTHYAYYVEVEGERGYMYAEDCDFYDEGYWSVVGSIFSSGRQWTVRNAKKSGHFEIKERLFVRDKPGTKGTNKIYLFYENAKLPEEYEHGAYVEVIHATEEQETIDGKTGRWLEIKYKDIQGWVFEGYVDCTLFYGWTPEDCVEMMFTYGRR